MDEVAKAINHFSALMEDQNTKLDAVLESVGAVRQELARVPKREEFDELKQDVKTIKAAVTDLSRDLKKHKSCQPVWRLGIRDSSKSADCGCDVLAFAKNNPVPGFVAAIQFVQRATCKHVFICWRCADERYKARQMWAC